jgi:hypothetical protein
MKKDKEQNKDSAIHLSAFEKALEKELNKGAAPQQHVRWDGHGNYETIPADSDW